MWRRVKASFVAVVIVAIVEGSPAEVVADTCWAAADVITRVAPYSCSFARSLSSGERKDLGHQAGAQQATKGVEAGNYLIATTDEAQADSRHSYSVASSIVDKEAVAKTDIAVVDVDTAMKVAIVALVIGEVEEDITEAVAIGLEAIDTAAISKEVIAMAANCTVAIAAVAITAEGNYLKEDNCFEEVGFHQQLHYHFHSQNQS